MITLPATEHNHTLTGTILYCLVTEAHGVSTLPKAYAVALGQIQTQSVDLKSDMS